MRCGKPEHQLGQKCVAKNAQCKDCHKIGHFHKVCQSKKRTKRANLAQTPPQDDDDTPINEIGVRQPNLPRVNMLKTINHIEATRVPQGKHLKFPITTHPKGPYKHHLVVRVDTMTTKQVNPVHVHQDTPHKAPLGHCAHVHKLTIQVCKPGELLALRKVKHPHNGRTSVNRLPLTKELM